MEMHTTLISLGLAKFIPPTAKMVIDHTMPNDDDEIDIPAVNGSITRRRMNATRILSAVNDGYDLVWMIAKEAKVGEQTTREILNELSSQGLIRKASQHHRGSPNRYFPA